MQVDKVEERKRLGHGKTVYIYIKRSYPSRPHGPRDRSGITIARVSHWLLVHRWLQSNFGPSVGAAPRDVNL